MGIWDERNKMVQCPRCKGTGTDPEQDPNDWPMGVVVCGFCWDRKEVPIWSAKEYEEVNK